jgi:hypothetical protein
MIRAFSTVLPYRTALEKRILIAGCIGNAIISFFETAQGELELNTLFRDEDFKKKVGKAAGLQGEDLKYWTNPVGEGEILHLFGEVYDLGDPDWLRQDNEAREEIKTLAQMILEEGELAGSLRFHSNEMMFLLKSVSGKDLLMESSDEREGIRRKHAFRSLSPTYFNDSNETMIRLNDEWNVFLTLPGKPEAGTDFLLAFEIMPTSKEKNA